MVIIDKGYIKMEGTKATILAEIATLLGAIYREKEFCNGDKEKFKKIFERVTTVEDMAKDTFADDFSNKSKVVKKLNEDLDKDCKTNEDDFSLKDFKNFIEDFMKKKGLE